MNDNESQGNGEKIPASTPEPTPVSAATTLESGSVFLNDAVESTAVPTSIPASVNAADTTDSAEPAEIVKAPLTFIQEAEFSSDQPWDEFKETIDLPSRSREESNRALEDAPNVSLTNSPELRKWADVFSTSMNNGPYEDNYLGTVMRGNASWHQGIRGKDSILTGAHPKFRNTSDNTPLVGDKATLRFQDFLGMGTVFQVPLWHSGFWMTLRAPSEGALLELQRQVIADKITFGRASHGLSFSNVMAYMADRLVSFAIAHMYESTVANPSDLKDLISSHDIPALIWGLVCSIYPRGFQYRRACTTDTEKCTNVVEARLDLSKLLWTNKYSLTEAQIAHMSKRRANSMNIESVKKYKEELLDCQNRDITVGGDTATPFKCILTIPTAAEYFDSGSRWIGDIVTMINKALGDESAIAERNQYIIKHGQATAMRQYLHWVHSIEFDGKLVEDRESLEGMFDVIGSDDTIRNEFMAKIRDYIDDTTISIVGIPAFDCPVCSGVQKGTNPKQTSVIPIDMYQTFFTLLVQKLQRLTVR